MKNFKCIAIFLAIFIAVTSCENNNDNETVYKGKVINTVTSKPFPNLEVKVTDGEHVNSTVKTDENGQFSILVKFNEINANYYLLIGDASCKQVRRDFKGFGQAEINLGDIEVEGPKGATITTKGVSAITSTSAMCGGNITDDGRSEVTARGVCWAKVEYPTISDSHTTNGTGNGEFNSEITGLESSTKYFIRAYAVNSAGVVYGQQISFNTYGNTPVVETLEIKDIRTSTAKCGGNVKYDGGSTITACGVCWSSKTSTPTVKDDHTEDFYSVGTYSSILTNLTAKTTYFVRAYATNGNGTSYGESKMFTSGNGMPIVETTPVGENITKESIISGGNVVDDGGYDVTSRGVVWGYVPYPTVGKSTQVDAGDGLGYFSAEIKNVDITNVNAVYIRAFAMNSVGTSYGEQVVVTKVNYDYATLPTMDFGGYHYKIRYMGEMSWSAANDICDNFVLNGFSDWYLPNYNEAHTMFSKIETKGWIWTSDKYPDDYYHHSYYYCIDGDGHENFTNSSVPLNVYAVRKYRTE